MIRISTIKAALIGLVGWEKPYTTDIELGDDLTSSSSGLTFNAVHPLLTHANLRATLPDDWEASGKTYADFLLMMEENSIAKVMQTFMRDKTIQRETRSLLDHRNFFDAAGRFNDWVTPSEKICGFGITPRRQVGVTIKVEKVGLQMRDAVGTVKLYLFHSSQPDPIKTIEVEYTKTHGGMQWFEVNDWFLPYESAGINPGGQWFICYNQDELPDGMRAINTSRDWSKGPCGTCNNGDPQLWREYTKYMRIMPFMTPNWDGWTEEPQMWDLQDTMETNVTSYGLNVQVSIACDLTDFIIQQKDIFAEVVQKQTAVDALRYIAMNPNVRVNRNQTNVDRSTILYEIDGDSQGVRPTGLGADLKNAYKALRIDTQGMSSVCLSCNNYGVHYGAV